MQSLVLEKKQHWLSLVALTATMVLFLDGPIQHASAAEIQHDAEHYMLLAQHGERWMREDKEVAAKLEEIRNKNGGKPPNILFVLIDDVGFGEMGETTQRRFLCVGIKERQLEI